VVYKNLILQYLLSLKYLLFFILQLGVHKSSTISLCDIISSNINMFDKEITYWYTTFKILKLIYTLTTFTSFCEIFLYNLSINKKENIMVLYNILKYGKFFT